MTRKVIFSPEAKDELEGILNFLRDDWSETVLRKFIERLDEKMRQVARFPESCPESVDVKGLRKCFVTGQISFYYRIAKDDIQITALFDSRQDPGRLLKY